MPSVILPFTEEPPPPHSSQGYPLEFVQYRVPRTIQATKAVSQSVQTVNQSQAPNESIAVSPSVKVAARQSRCEREKSMRLAVYLENVCYYEQTL